MLFRPEVTEARTRRLWGDVRLSQPPSLTFWTGIMTTVGVVLVLCLTFGTYVRKESVSGYLIPDTGVVQIVAPRPGRISRIAAREGDVVSAQAILAEFADGAVGTEVGQVLSAQLSEIRSQVRSEASRQAAELEGIEGEAQALRARLAAQAASRLLVEQRLNQQSEAAAIAERQVERYRSLVERGFGAQSRLDDLDRQLLMQRSEMTSSERELQVIDGNIADLNSQLTSLGPRAAGLVAAAEASRSSLEQRYIDVSSSSSFSVMAPVEGRISSAQVVLGQTVRADEPLMSIMPRGAKLEAELLLPTRAAGFIGQGDEVRLRVDAFPSQRFGVVTGRVASVSRSVVRPGDYLAPIEYREAMYRVRVSLDREYVSAYGARQPLRPGMSLIADIVIDRRPLWRQLFDPLLAAGQRLS